MLDQIIGRIPSSLILTCALFSMLIPFGIYKFNRLMHKKADPPWKKAIKKQPKGKQTKEDNGQAKHKTEDGKQN